MRDIDYQPDIRGTNQVMNSSEMEAFIKAETEKAKLFAISISPHGSERNGHYADRFETSVRKHGGPKNDRVEGELLNTSDYATAVEANHQVLRKTISAVEKGRHG